MKIYIVEDDKWYREYLTYQISLNSNYSVRSFESAKPFLKAMLDEKPDVVCLDFSLPDSSGELLLNKIKKVAPESEVIIISGQEEVKVAVSLLKLGAHEYLTKDDETKDRLWNILLKIGEMKSLTQEVKLLRTEVKNQYASTSQIIGESVVMKNVYQLIKKASSSNISVNITGETGTGKEVVAKAIHYRSNSKGPFIAINVQAIPSELIESELFGHEKGSFTGATNRRIGKFEEANNGTLFLDEIGEMDLNMQTKLLRALQEREIMRIGGDKKIALNIRVMTATHKNLVEEVEKGNFRQDLYYRLMGVLIDMPPLRKKQEDIPLLIQFFIEKFCEENNLKIYTISQEGIEKLMAHSFPGNVRELKALVDLSMAMCEGSFIDESDIKIHAAGMSFDNLVSNEKSLQEYNLIIVRHFLEKYNNNVIKVAKALGVGKSTIYRMMQSYNLTA
jgi:DNA-binding NtrC family response regulator